MCEHSHSDQDRVSKTNCHSATDKCSQVLIQWTGIRACFRTTSRVSILIALQSEAQLCVQRDDGDRHDLRAGRDTQHIGALRARVLLHHQPPDPADASGGDVRRQVSVQWGRAEEVNTSPHLLIGRKKE